ncbi:MAG: ribosome biogenesis GTPase YlqF, partial [Oscillospiraceae bacterium]|nr:ribosome biogenesis GTPase YlqF [Oscillospiraceae bacterium]
LLDTPGVLWPKFEDEQTGLLLAYTGAVRDDILDVETLAARLMDLLGRRYPEALTARYHLAPGSEPDGFALLEAAARRRGFLVSGGAPDTERMARTLLDEYRSGRLGRFTLEEPEAAT